MPLLFRSISVTASISASLNEPLPFVSTFSETQAMKVSSGKFDALTATSARAAPPPPTVSRNMQEKINAKKCFILIKRILPKKNLMRSKLDEIV